MRERADYYPYYEKLRRMKLEEPIAEAPEYKVLAERYPHLAESIRLKREIKRLKEKLKPSKERSTRLQIKKEIVRTKAKLKRENVLKRLHGESKQETIFNIHFTIATSKEHVSSLTRRTHVTLWKARRGLRSINRALRRLMHRKLPPSVFDLKSLDTAEKGLAVREWFQSHRKKRR